MPHDETKEAPKAAPPPARMTFCIADLKYTPDGKVKLLELGRGVDSAFQGYMAVNNKSIHADFWNYLDRHGLKIFCHIDQFRVLMMPGDYLKQREPDLLQQLGGVCHTNLEALIESLVSGNSYPGTRDNVNPSKLSSFSGVFVTDIPQSQALEKKLSEKLARCPGILLLDAGGSTAPFVEDKFLTRLMMSELKLDEFFPSWRLFPKVYKKSLAEEIKASISGSRYVIKPLNATRGNGIIVVDENDLETTLQKILLPEDELERRKEEIKLKECRPILGEGSYEHWLIDRDPVFLVESCESSVPVKVGKHSYDGTLRAVFVMKQDNGRTSVDFLDAYWKLPLSPKDAGTLQAQTVSKISKDEERASSANVDGRIKQAVFKQLGGFLPKIYRGMLDRTEENIPRQLIYSSSPAHIAYGIFLLSRKTDYTADLISRFVSLANKHDDLYDAMLVKLVPKSEKGWVKSGAKLAPLAHILILSGTATIRENVLRSALNYSNNVEAKKVIEAFRGTKKRIKNLLLRAEYLSYLHRTKLIDDQGLLKGYGEIFAKDDGLLEPAKKYILKSVVNLKLFFKARWLLDALLNHSTLIYVRFFNLASSKESLLTEQAIGTAMNERCEQLLKEVRKADVGELVQLFKIANYFQRMSTSDLILKKLATLYASEHKHDNALLVLLNESSSWRSGLIYNTFRLRAAAIETYLKAIHKEEEQGVVQRKR